MTLRLVKMKAICGYVSKYYNEHLDVPKKLSLTMHVFRFLYSLYRFTFFLLHHFVQSLKSDQMYPLAKDRTQEDILGNQMFHSLH